MNKCTIKSEACQVDTTNHDHLIQALNEELSDLVISDPDRLVDWPGTDLLARLIRRKQFCLLISPASGSGLSCSIALQEAENDEDNILFLYQATTSEMTKAIWGYLGSPVSTARFQVSRHDGPAYTCKGCPRYCWVVGEEEPQSRLGSGIKCTKEDFKDALNRTSGRCPTLQQLVQENLDQLSGQTIVIRAPSIDREFVDLVNTLSACHVIIGLSAAQAAKLPYQFRRWPRVTFPRPGPEFFEAFLEKNLEASGETRFPLDTQGVSLITILASCNPRQFTSYISAVLDCSNGVKIGPQEILKILGPFSLDLLLKLAIAQFAGQVITASDVSDLLSGLTGQYLSPEQVGRRLSNLGFAQNRTNDRRLYEIPGSHHREKVTVSDSKSRLGLSLGDSMSTFKNNSPGEGGVKC